MEARIEKMQKMINKDQELRNKQTEMNNTVIERKSDKSGFGEILKPGSLRRSE